MNERQRGWWVAALTVLPLLGWWTYGLFDLDEGFYAAITAEMNRRGEWITPFYNGSPWFEKPILLYWVAKPFLALFGEMAGPRMPSILANLLLYFMVYRAGRQAFGSLAGHLAAIILGTSLLVVASGRMMLTDPLLVLTFAGCLLLFWRSLQEGASPWVRPLSAVCLGLAILSKGPVAGAFFLLVAGLTFWRVPDLRSRFRGGWLASVALLILTVASWYLPAYLANPQTFVQEFLIEQNIGRFQGGDEAHKVPMPAGLVFFVPVLLLGMAPWVFALPRIFRERPADAAAPFRTYLWIWFWVVFGFFSISGSKLVHYILPALPALALLLGDGLSRFWDGALSQRRIVLITAWSLGLAAFVQFGFTTYYAGGNAFGQKVPGFHAEVHRIGWFLRDKPGQVTVFQMPKRSKSLGTGKPKIQETSHPSFLLYLGRNVEQADKISEVKPGWLVTRWNRVDAAAFAAEGWMVTPVETPFVQDLYRLFRVERR